MRASQPTAAIVARMERASSPEKVKLVRVIRLLPPRARRAPASPYRTDRTAQGRPRERINRE
ncbi:MAG: hypothetical protein SangKO_083310 [Sandaracinaceae bacterium]